MKGKDSCPAHVALMASVLGAYCKQHGIADQVERDKIAERIVALYEFGVTQEGELLAGLRHAIN
jgi:hypothetical protein